MKFTQFKIRRFRAFESECAIPLSDFTVLTGPNNLGKSTVLRALGMFFDAVQRSDSTMRSFSAFRYNYRDDYPKACQVRPGRKPSTRLSVTVELSPEEEASALEATGLSLPSVMECHAEFDPKHQWRISYKCDALGAPEALRFAKWLGSNCGYIYIPATRNVDDFKRSAFSELVEASIIGLRQSKRRIGAIKNFYEDVKVQIGKVEAQLADELRAYLPDVKQVSLVLGDLDVLNLVSLEDIEINDGAKTRFAQKGDGFKSLFAMSLVQYMARRRYAKNLIFGIEEPESHLHAEAVYKVKAGLRQLSKTFQVIVTTHSPILIQRDAVSSNIIVDQVPGTEFACSVTPAERLSDIRKALGIKPQDNMTTAEVIVVVEGRTEESCLGALLGRCDTAVAEAATEGRVKILSAGSASKIVSVVRALARDAASCIVLVDDDEEGRKAENDISKSGLVDNRDVFRVPGRSGCLETEFEDLFQPSHYMGELATALGVDLGESEFDMAQRQSGDSNTRTKKWSDVMRTLMEERGRSWDSDMVKTSFARAIVSRVAAIDPRQFPLFRSMGIRVLSYLQQ